jgi:hypothetical protein
MRTRAVSDEMLAGQLWEYPGPTPGADFATVPQYVAIIPP